MLFYKGLVDKVEQNNIPVERRSWRNENFGTGQPAPTSQKSMYGGVPFHEPVKFNFETPGAGKPHKSKKVVE